MMNERNLIPLSLELEGVRKEAEQIASDWNGKDEKFISGGLVYTEDDASLMIEITEKCKELKDLFNEVLE